MSWLGCSADFQTSDAGLQKVIFLLLFEMLSRGIKCQNVCINENVFKFNGVAVTLKGFPGPVLKLTLKIK